MPTVEKNEIPAKAKPVVMAMKACAVMFWLVGISCLLFPTAIGGFLGFDDSHLLLFGGIFFVVGIVEFFVIPSILIQAHKNK